MDAWPPRLRSCTSENGLSQEDRILALLEEMRPARRSRDSFYPAPPAPLAPPNYHTIYPSSKRPSPLPSYGDVVRVAPSRLDQHSPSSGSTTLSRCSPRQASFMAAVRNGEERQRRREAQTRRRTTVYGDEVYSSAGPVDSSDLRDVNHNEKKMISRRGRPKSYVLATSASLPETDPSSFSHDDTSRDMSSMGSLSSIEPSARSVQPAQSTKSLQKFIALFQKDGVGRLRPKRSRTSLPESRVPLPDTSVPASRVLRQGWLKHQEVVLGRKGSRSQWCSRWAVLSDATLYLCMQPSTSTTETLQLVAPVSRLDVASSVVDIAYDWLSHARHVLRLVCQSRSEHLLELLTEADMLSWITALQSAASSPPEPSSIMANSCSAASLASSCSSDRHVAVANPATNQLIMQRYKAKSSQLQSPSSKRASEHISQPGSSKENHVENGETSTTPKSARKWKKSKANKQGSGSSGGSGPAPSILGIRLAECVTSDPEEPIPLVIQICVSAVEEHGLDSVGIYRIPGNTAAVNGLKDHLSQGIDSMSIETTDLSDARWRDVNVVSSFLKMFLRKLPEPLLTDKLYPFFIDANRIPSHNNRLHKLRNLLRKLPRAHYCTLRYLIRHLSAVSKNSEVNMMETRNVALMFGPSIVRPSDDNMATMVTHMSDQCKIVETFIYYQEWMFDDNSPADDVVPLQHPSEIAEPRTETAQYGVVNPGAVSAATFNDMHMLIRKANEEQAAALMNEGKAGKIKNILRRNSRRDKSKGKPKIESTAPAAVHPRYNCTPPQSSVDSAFHGAYQERDIDAEIISRQTVSPLASTVEQSPSIESSLGSIPDTSRTDPGPSDLNNHAEDHRRRQQDMYSARRIFIAGSEAAAATSTIHALASHTQHLNTASSPALEVLSEETRAKIRKMQMKQSWIEKPVDPPRDFLKSPTKDQMDALSCTSDYSTTSSAPCTAPLVVDPPSSSDYASSDPSPCAKSSPRPRPNALSLNEASRCQQKIKMRSKGAARDPSRRHTLSDMDAFKEGRLEKFARWIGLRRSSPDVTKEDPTPMRQPPPAIVRTSPNELTPASGDEQL